MFDKIDMRHIIALVWIILFILLWTIFELTFGQLESTVENRNDNAIEFVGALKESLKFVVKAFSGP